jgi:dTDP-4-amino-4,6-dideoxygalactose transaminase
MVSSEAAPETLLQTPQEAWPFFAEDEIDAVTSVLRSGKVNQWTGHFVKDFQNAFTDWIGGGHGIALANGSLALELPLRAFGIGPGDEVIVTPRTFVASASCVRLVGATPVFADIDPISGNITPETIAAVITPRTKAIIPVHLAGWPCDMEAIMALAAEHGLKVIEDCAQAHGAMIGDRMAGSFGHAAAFSFCQDKIMTTGGEGGFTIFQDEAAWEWAWSFKDHGKNWQTVNTPPEKPGFRWLHDSVGTNWRMTEMQAVIGLKQLAKMTDWTDARTRNAMAWRDAVAGINGLTAPVPASGVKHAFYKFYMYLDPALDKVEAVRDRILAACSEAGLKVFSGSCSEVYLEKAFSDLSQPQLPAAHQLSQTSLMVEVHPTLDHERLKSRANWFKQIAQPILAGG